MKLACAAVVALGSFVSFASVPAAQDARPAADPIVDLGTLGGLASIALAVNDRRQVIGLSQISPLGDIHSFLWEGGVMRDLALTSGLRFDGALDINDRGQIVGSAIDEATFIATAAIWEDGRLTELDLPAGAVGCSGMAINDHGEVAGTCFDGTGNLGVVWPRKGGVAIIGALPGVGACVPRAINDHGVVVGVIEGTGPEVLIAALLFDRRGLTQLPGLSVPANNQAVAINRHGAIAGTSAGAGVVWVDGRPRTLPPLPGGFSALAYDINDRGDVVGDATTPDLGDPHAVLWPRAAAHRPDNTID
jgi:probable HAF family extracellular repeat protein